MKYFIVISVFLVMMYLQDSETAITDYFKTVGNFFGFTRNEGDDLQSSNLLISSVPYELSINDEKFLSEAAKLTGVTLSQLDTCQHRVIYKLQSSCNNMNDEEVSKVAVMLLNCQSWVEGRKIYPCSESMSIRECTKEMDADAWNSYHLITNRARAVCYSVRQNQFRGLTELTVNKLMTAAKQQINEINKIAQQQDQLHELTQLSLQSVNEGHEKIVAQQRDFYQAQLHGQLSLEDNIKRLSDEKEIISEAHKKLTEMTKSVQNKLSDAAKQLEKQADESKGNHDELIEDLESIQRKTEEIFQRIEQSIDLLATQNQLAQEQYKSTFAQLSEFNETIHYLISLVDITKKTIDERLSWLTTTLGGTDLTIEKLYAILWHSLFLIVTMVGCAFFSAYFSIRIAVTTLPIVNLFLALKKSEYVLTPIALIAFLGVFIAAQLVFVAALKFYKSRSNISNQKPLMLCEKETITSTYSPVINNNGISNNNYKSTVESEKHLNSPTSDYFENSETHEDKTGDEVDAYEYGRLTPLTLRSRSRTPLSLSNGQMKRACCATTRKGTPCKLISMPGRDFCTRHQYGDSVMMS